MKTSRWSLLLLSSLVACAPFRSQSINNRDASSLGASADPTKVYELLSDGTLRVWQDKAFSFQPAGGAAGTYAVTGLPAWASFDASNGRVTGTVRTAADAGSFTISLTSGGTTQRFGPYAVEVVGDVLKEQQWHLTNRGQKAYAYLAGATGEDIGIAQTVVENVLGASVRVAISDSGTYVAHPDLAPNNLVAENRNYLTGSSGAWVGDPTPSVSEPEYAHGTAVAGLTAAKGWNGIGGRGVAPEAKFAAFLYVQAQDQLAARGLADVALYDQYDGTFDVFNYSWGMPQCELSSMSNSYFTKLQDGVTTGRGGRGSIFVVAGGNDFYADPENCYSTAGAHDVIYGNVSFSSAQATPYVINVGAVTAAGKVSSYSTPGSGLWVSAPGGEYGYSRAVPGASFAGEPALVTTDYPGCANGLKSLNAGNNTFDSGTTPNRDCRYTATMNGTSGASPIVTGAIALMLDKNPALTWRDVKYILARTADQVDPTQAGRNHEESAYRLAGHTYERGWQLNHAPVPLHFHNWYGFGRVNVDAAVARADTWVAGSLGALVDTGWVSSAAINATVPDNSAAGLTRTLTVGALTVEAVQVQVSITNCVGDVGLELTSPQGTTSILMNINSHLRETSMTDHTFLANAFLDEAAGGNWELKVIDGHASCTPTLNSWRIRVLGH